MVALEVCARDSQAEAHDNQVVAHQNVQEDPHDKQVVVDLGNQVEAVPTMEVGILDSQVVVDVNLELAVSIRLAGLRGLAGGSGTEEALLLAEVVYLVVVVHLVVGVVHRPMLEEFPLRQAEDHQVQLEHRMVLEADESDLVAPHERMVAVATCLVEVGSQVDPSTHLEAPQVVAAFLGGGASSRQVAAHISLFHHHHHHLFHCSCYPQNRHGSSILPPSPLKV
jgi:hypothetical protein